MDADFLNTVKQRTLEAWVNVARPAFEKTGRWISSRLPMLSAPADKGPRCTLACDFGQSKIALVEILNAGDPLTITGFQMISRGGGAGQDVANLKACYSQGRFTANKVRISMKGQGVVTRFIQFPKMNSEELRSAMTFEAEKYIPFKTNEVILDFQVIEERPAAAGRPEQLTVLLVAVKRDEIYPLVQTFRDAGLEIEFVDADALALINALEYFHADAFHSSAAIFDFGREVSTLSVVQAGKPRFIRDVSFGGVDIVKRLRRKLGLSDEAAVQYLQMEKSASPEVGEVISDGLGALVADLKVSLDYYLDHAEGAVAVKTLFLGGGQACHPIVQKCLARDLGIGVQAMSILSKLRVSETIDMEQLKRNEGFLPVVMGLCVRPS